MAKKTYFCLILILVIAAFIRFYRLPEYLQFLGDEGRDVLIVKQMIVDHKFTLLGPTASVGGFYIGPIYYYFMLPFLWLFRLDPIGPAVMASLFGLGTIVLVYYFCKHFVNAKVGLLAAFLITISPRMIDMSRFSWNPNPMPFFALLTIFLLYFSVAGKKILFTFLAGVSVGIMLQLHYIDLVFLPIAGLSLMLLFPIRQWFFQFVSLGLGILLGNSLFLIFEFRHNFPNIKSVWEFLTRKSTPVAPRSLNFIALFDDVARQLFDNYLSFAGKISENIYHLSLLGFGIWIAKSVTDKTNRPKMILLLVWLIVGVLGLGSYRGTLHSHYFGYLYPLPAIMMAVTLSLLLNKKWLWPVFIVALIFISYLQIQKWYLWTPPNNLVEQTKNVDKIVLQMVEDQPYNFALITPGNSDHAYRYFLELQGSKPIVIENPQIDPERNTVTNQLIVICEGPCAPLGNPLWEVAGFGRAEVAQTRQAPVGITVYKLVHYKGG
ncbi:MAG: glycosyltransferase family 39 protein [Patescibacteria group bacterium]